MLTTFVSLVSIFGLMGLLAVFSFLAYQISQTETSASVPVRVESSSKSHRRV
ncbi:hypothetical protein [Candidatus Enterococcus lowellii]|uniref:hypothetical protein n=1 Tax=Candidatus Enterococcus lowellii TaxID=2230877 RepID=UPI001A9DB9BD|nr:hypothetical protein [Enterococcus sp. DIV2402]MBO0464375.1 hypothetical protein [Enterococcus sp. DIV2402]